MIWFVLFQVLGLCFMIGMWNVVYRFFHTKEYEETFIEYMFDRIKKVLISLLVGFSFLTAVMFMPLYHTTQCSIKGVSMNANTKYSWVMGECLMQTKDGSWIPLKITRGVPNGADNDHDGYPD